MKNLSFWGLTCLFLASVVMGADTRKFDINNFSEVEVGWGMHVQISQSGQYSVEVKAEDKDFKYLKVEKKGNALKVYIDKRNYNKQGEVYITLTMPSLSAVTLSGGAEGKIDMNEPDEQFTAELSGGAQLKGDLECSDIRMDLSGGSQVTLNGKAGNLSADGSGGSIFHLKDMNVKNVDADLSGGTIVYVSMNGKLNVEASGGSLVKYYGHPDIGEMNFSGGAGISQGD